MMTRLRFIGRLIVLAALAACMALAAILVVPPVTARPVYSVSQIMMGLDPRHNMWGGRTVWVRAVAVLGQDVGTLPNRGVLFDHAPPGTSDGFYVTVKQPNLTFTLLSWRDYCPRAAGAGLAIRLATRHLPCAILPSVRRDALVHVVPRRPTGVTVTLATIDTSREMNMCALAARNGPHTV